MLAALIPLFSRPTPASAELVAWEGTLALDFLASAIPDPRIVGSGVATIDASSGGLALAALQLRGGLTGTALVPLTDPDVTANFKAISALASLGTGTLQPFHPPAPSFQPQLSQDSLPIRGRVRLCTLSADCSLGLDLPLSTHAGQTAIGVGGLLTAGGAGAVRISVEGAPWTVKTASVAVPTANGSGSVAVPGFGWVHGAFSFTGSTAVTGGALQLVTPIQITSNDELGPLSGFGVLAIRFVPESGLVPLLGAGIAGLLLIAAADPRGRH